MNKNISRRILHLFYPNRCPVCGEIIDAQDMFCTDCPEKLTVCRGTFSIPDSDGFCASFEYNDAVTPAVMLLKDGICGNAAFALGSSLAETVEKCGFADKTDIIIPVPMYRFDKLKRGYNQSELIARVVSDKLGKPLCTNAVIKSRKTQMQKNLTARERAVNLCGAFSVTDTSLVKGKSVLLVDDVCTTGSTLSEIVKLLKACGASRVYCAGCCKTPEKNNNNEV
ncbi:MAG: ComF family protein [Ruminococcus sp.]|nr:ComF family protein [Ruminococcus sp.]